MEEKPKRKQKWNELRRKHTPKPITPDPRNAVKTYYLTEEELAYYRSLKPPIPDKLVSTTAVRHNRARNWHNKSSYNH